MNMNMRGCAWWMIVDEIEGKPNVQVTRDEDWKCNGIPEIREEEGKVTNLLEILVVL